MVITFRTVIVCARCAAGLSDFDLQEIGRCPLFYIFPNMDRLLTAYILYYFTRIPVDKHP